MAPTEYSPFMVMQLKYRSAIRVIRVPVRRINEIVHGKRQIAADTALGLGLFFNIPAQFWLGLQMEYDLDQASDQFEVRLIK